MARLSYMLALLLFSALFHATNQKAEKKPLTGLENSPLREVQGLQDKKVLLPCDMDPPTRNDSVHLVLFYKGDLGTPIYSLDSRGVSIEAAKHWAEKGFSKRTEMSTTRGERGLLLFDVTLEDEGEYICRVDFTGTPTKIMRVRLSVVVPPKNLSITSDHFPGVPRGTTGGPYAEGAQVVLSCQVFGGRPRPNVTWWEARTLIDEMSEVKTSSFTRNNLLLSPLTRDDLFKNLTCQASNSNLESPLKTTVTLDIHYTPTSVRIQSESEEGQVQMAEGVTRSLRCVAEGSRPPAIITWWRNGEVVDDTHERIEEIPSSTRNDGARLSEVSRSTLMFTPDVTDDGATITCKVSNPSLPHIILQNSTEISVLYRPRIELQFGATVDLENLEEGDSVHFKCLVSANPPVTGIVWAHDGVPLRSTERIEVKPGELTLKEITRGASGDYTCAAANSEGSNTSNILSLAVKFPPRCSSGQQSVYGAARHEHLRVPCVVEAHPVPNMFRWAVNTSTGMVDVPLNLSISRGLRSEVVYTPQTHHDFGDLLCWAVNQAGQQLVPCVFSVVPAAKPETVSDCTADRNSSMPTTYVVVRCTAGWDGGLNQTFTLEVRKAAKEETLDNFSHAPEPFFVVRGLQEGVEYLLTVTAANPRGSSSPVTMNYTVPATSAHKVVSPYTHSTFLTFLPLLLLLLGILLTLVTCVGVVLGRKERRRRRKNREREKVVFSGNGGARKDDGQLENNSEVHTIVKLSKEDESVELLRDSDDSSVTQENLGCVFLTPTQVQRVQNSNGPQHHESDVLQSEKSNGLAPLAAAEDLEMEPIADTRSSKPAALRSSSSPLTSSSSSSSSLAKSSSSSSVLPEEADNLTKEEKEVLKKASHSSCHGGFSLNSPIQLHQNGIA